MLNLERLESLISDAKSAPMFEKVQAVERVAEEAINQLGRAAGELNDHETRLRRLEAVMCEQGAARL